MGFASKKKKKSTCPNALEFSMTIVMLHNDDQDSVKILEAQPKTMAANEIVHYSVITIKSKKKQNTYILHGLEALNG